MSIVHKDTVKGSFHQADPTKFNENSLGRQCLAIAVAGAIYATKLPLHIWTSATLDRILLAGDTLFQRRCNSNYDYLQISDIQNTEQLFRDEYVINMDSPMTGLLQSEIVPSPPFFNLRQAISSMENRHIWKYGILTLASESSGVSVLICVQEGNYYIFDSHSRDNYGNVCQNGESVLLHIRSQNDFIKYIRRIGHQTASSQFELTPLAPIEIGTYRMLQPNRGLQTRSSTSSSKKESTQKLSQMDIQPNARVRTRSSTRSSKKESTSQMDIQPNTGVRTRSCTRSSKKESTQKLSQMDINSNNSKHETCSDRKETNVGKNKKESKRKTDKKDHEDDNDKTKRTKGISQKKSSSQEEKSKLKRSETISEYRLRKTIEKSERNLSQNMSMQRKRNVSTSDNSEQSQKKTSAQNRKNINLEKEQDTSDKTNTKSTGKHTRQSTNKRNTEVNKQVQNHGHLGIHNDNNTNNMPHTTSTDNNNGIIDIDECLKLFNVNISNGPIYVCTVCLQTWFRRSVSELGKIHISSEEEELKLNQCRRHYISAEDKEWICRTCRDSIKEGRIPKLSIENKMGFPVRPKELDINGMEERFTSPRLTLFQLKYLHCGGQASVTGNSVNLPIDIAPTVDMLPRTLDNTETIAVNLKRRMCYKGSAFKKENIRPAAVWTAVNYLMTHSQMYKNLDIQLDTSWMTNMQNCDSNTCDCSEQNTQQNSQLQEELHNGDDENIDNIEEDEDVHNIHRDTMLSAPESVPRELTFAPGEGQHPISVFYDPDAEYLSFPTIFCGQRRASDEERDSSVHYTEICKYELRSVDRRVATNIPNVFFKLKKVQMKHVLDTVSLAMRRVKGKHVCAKNVLDDESRANIVRLDEGYYIFRKLRNSPAYLDKRKKDAFAMIRQIGFPSLFISLSAAETKWPELLRAIGQLNDKKTYTDEEISQMDTQKIFSLIRKDSATVVRYFHHRFQTFLYDVLKSKLNPIGNITDYFWRYEFAKRGALHVHWFAYLKDAPVYGIDSNNDVIRYYDKIISCSKDVEPENKEYIKYQMHRHTKTCLRGKRKKCRFGFPQPPMPETIILEPFTKDDEEEEELGKQNWKKIKKVLDEFKLAEDVTITFHELLEQLNMNITQYISAVRTTIVRTKMFFKRQPSEIRINNYMKNCFHFWRANHDIQPSIEPYGMVKYILSYVTKGQKGMSIVMEKACREARNGNMDLKQSVRHMGNAFLNGVETSQEEAACLLLGIPITQMSRKVVFINTTPIEQRTFVLKSMEDIKKLDPESTDVVSTNMITSYEKRSLKHF